MEYSKKVKAFVTRKFATANPADYSTASTKEPCSPNFGLQRTDSSEQLYKLGLFVTTLPFDLVVGDSERVL